MLGPWTTHPKAAHDPAGEVVELCRELIRIDTCNYGDDSGPGERKAAEYVAALLDEVGIESHARRGLDPVGPTWSPAGAARDGRRPAAARPPRRRTRGSRGLAGRPLLRRDPGRLRLGPRRGRHEGLRRDAAQRRPRPAADRCGSRPRRSRCASPPTRRPAATRVPQMLVEQHPELLEGCTEAVGEVGGFSATVRGRRVYLIEAAEKGMAWMRLTARGRAGHGSMINRENAVTRSPAPSRGSAPTSGRCGSRPTMRDAARGRRRARRHRGDAGERRGAGRGVRRRGADDGRGHPQHLQPDDARRRLQGQRDPDRGDGARRRPLPARLRGRVLRDPGRAGRRRHRDRLRQSTSSRGRRRTTATWSTR